MALHAYVDESKRRDYIVAAAVITAAEVAAARRAMRGLLLPKQPRIHFKDEKGPRKEQIVTVALDISVEARIYVCRTRHSARENCLTAMVPDLVAVGVDRLVLERDTSTERLDKRVLFEATRKAGTEMTYQHDMPRQEPLLWAPDAIAWCWAAGGAWRQRVADHVTVIEAG
ncbi:hypothetical protein E1262_27120 [Jiangella aurantiaca]|uniref:DUF3800 domain-containing protein n=1 Tax=Jiangella aurantiaca TaxID=2530373 RepID=A0A4R5A054_9ACTN|nr:hypothetical protein [Jiangella aurantiaca]TDD64765.1 hypothetical protein E1262_27120 [Jiangella aurantiaca]